MASFNERSIAVGVFGLKYLSPNLDFSIKQKYFCLLEGYTPPLYFLTHVLILFKGQLQ